MFTPNEGTLDRDLRLVLAVLLMLVALFGPLGVWMLVPAALSVIMFVTAAVGVCPLYSLFGINTLQKKSR